MTLTIAATGDVMIHRESPHSIFDNVTDLLHEADVAVGQLETSYSDTGSMGSSGPRGAMPKDLSNYPAVAQSGFDVLSLASNHTMDWGRDALLDCMDRLRRDGIEPIGAGTNLQAACRPSVLERSGTRIAFLSFCSVAPEGYYATTDRAGVAPMRAITHYEQVEVDQPGTPCEILTFPRDTDLERLVASVEAATDIADVVVLSLHWGVHFVRARIADYQPEVAHAAIDAGADAVVGHHPHILKGVELYRGKPVLYSIGNFAFDFPERAGDDEYNERRQRVYDALVPTTEQRFQDDATYSTIANLLVEDGDVRETTLTPVWITDEAQPVPVSPSSERGTEIVDYLRSVTAEAELQTEYTVRDETVSVTP